MIFRQLLDPTSSTCSYLLGDPLTREAEVLYWVVKGKTNRDIGEILGTSPRTVTKHLEHVFDKLGVETRTAAAGMVLGRLGRLLGA